MIVCFDEIGTDFEYVNPKEDDFFNWKFVCLSVLIINKLKCYKKLKYIIISVINVYLIP